MPIRQQRSKRSRALTPREHEIVDLVIAGLSNKEIAQRLNLVEGTVKVYLHEIYQKVGVKNRTALAALLLQRSATSWRQFRSEIDGAYFGRLLYFWGMCNCENADFMFFGKSCQWL